MSGLYEIARSYELAVAHRLPTTPRGHKCHALHGHNLTITIACRGIVGAGGWVCDSAELDAAFEPLRKRLDHAFLNEIEGLSNPTSERLAVWIYERLESLSTILCTVTVCENGRSRVTYPAPPWPTEAA